MAPKDLVKTLPLLKFAPVAEAPTEPGKESGWCIVAPGGDHLWAVAHWNGEGWFATDGLPREPLIWALLPQIDLC